MLQYLLADNTKICATLRNSGQLLVATLSVYSLVHVEVPGFLRFELTTRKKCELKGWKNLSQEITQAILYVHM